MQIARSLAEIPPLPQPIALTIGNFDGVHLGHVHLINQLAKFGRSKVALTFQNHPFAVLHPESTPLKPLTTLDEKIDLFNRLELDLLILLPFTSETANLSFQKFIDQIRTKLPFQQLILGEDARLGQSRKGTPEKIKAYGQKVGFEAHFIEKISIDNHPVSSRQIRKALQKKDFPLAEKLLGRSFNF
ncbi:MAG: FAD synthetase family protein [Simkaniaceae bacterium]